MQAFNFYLAILIALMSLVVLKPLIHDIYFNGKYGHFLMIESPLVIPDNGLIHHGIPDNDFAFCTSIYTQKKKLYAEDCWSEESYSNPKPYPFSSNFSEMGSISNFPFNFMSYTFDKMSVANPNIGQHNGTLSISNFTFNGVSSNNSVVMTNTHIVFMGGSMDINHFAKKYGSVMTVLDKIVDTNEFQIINFCEIKDVKGLYPKSSDYDECKFVVAAKNVNT